MNLFSTIEEKVKKAFKEVGLENYPIVLKVATNPEFGDYQVNGVIGCAKKIKNDPRVLAQNIAQRIDNNIFENITVAGPGFINLRLSSKFIEKSLSDISNNPHLNIDKSQAGNIIIIDYSSPNLAKEMHVGHLRSTIIGDSISRVLSFLGGKVIAQNHVGDWGTQFGMLVAYLYELEKYNQDDFVLSDLEGFYRQAKIRFDEDENFATLAREYVTKLQGGDPDVLTLWEKFVKASLSHAQNIYNRLGVLLTEKDVMGESFYNNLLEPVVNELIESGIAVNENGTKLVFIEELADSEGKPSAYIIQKKDGGFLYSTTDLACVHYNVNHLNPTRLLYIVDVRQSLHFKSFFIIANKAGWLTDKIKAEHIAFGTMMGEDGKPFKTREGGTVKLNELIDEAEKRTSEVVKSKNSSLSSQEVQKIAKVLSIGAIKYSDLSKNRLSDYIFTWDNMLSLEGNTSLYLVYSYTRINSLLRKANYNGKVTEGYSFQDDSEKQLAVILLQFSDVLNDVASSCYTHYLCNYLYNLSTVFSRFYEHCPIINLDNEAKKTKRLELVSIAGRTLKTGLELLGIPVVDYL